VINSKKRRDRESEDSMVLLPENKWNFEGRSISVERLEETGGMNSRKRRSARREAERALFLLQL
jgi:hypothetical protein